MMIITTEYVFYKKKNEYVLNTQVEQFPCLQKRTFIMPTFHSGGQTHSPALN